MKKILTVSLFAMMAVSAANADIASTKYVTDRTGTTANLTTTAKELTGAVNELKTKLDTVAGDSTTSVADQITAAKNELTTEIEKVDDKADANAAAIEAADLAQVGADGSYISAVSQVNGKVSASAVAFKDAIAENETSTNAPTAKAVYDHVRSEMGVLSGNVGTIQSALNNTQSGLSELSGEFDAYVTSNNTAVQQAQADATAAGTAAAAADSKAQSAVDTNATQQTAINKNASDIAGITNTSTGILAQAKSYADAEDGKIEATIGTVEQGKTVVQMIADAKSAASGDAGAVADDLAEYIESNDAAVAAAKTQADKGVADAATAKTAADAAQDAADAAQGEVDAVEGVVAQQKTDLQKAISDGDTATLNAAKADAETKANAAKEAAITAAKSAGDAAYAAKSYEAIVDADKAFREAIASGTIGSDGTYALTATVSSGTVSGYKWEQIGR